MNTQRRNFASFIKSISIVYLAILIGVLSFMTVAYFNAKDMIFSFSEDKAKIYIGFAMSLGAVFLSKIIFNKLLEFDKTSMHLSKKLGRYFTAFIVKIALMEGVAFLNIVFFLESGNKVFLVATAIAILGLLMAKPTPEGIIESLKLNTKEQTYINNPDKKFDT